MAVQIDEVEVVPRAQEPKQQAPQQQPEGGPKPELAHEIASTVALLRSRDIRLRAD